MKDYKLVFLILIVLLFSKINCDLLTTTCDNDKSCSPSWCEAVTNSACTDTLKNQLIDAASVSRELSKMGCNSSCTQSTSSMCTNAFLSQTLKANSGLMSAYCNDNYLVLVANGTPNHNTGLSDIPRPPGQGGVSYSKACVTRSFHQSYNIYKIPLNPLKLSTASASNNISAFSGQTDPKNLPNMGLPESGPLAVSVTGQNVFPIFNNQGQIAHIECEMDKCSAHAGQGFDYHYHGDPYSNIPGRCMYSSADYPSDSKGHPPVIAFSLDGYLIYGRYLTTSGLGQTVALDDCGGHDHDGLGYHYHSQVLSFTTTDNKPYTAYIPGVYKCWRGDISGTNFFGTSAPPEQRPDYQSLKPCCSMTSNFYVATGVTVNGLSSTAGARIGSFTSTSTSTSTSSISETSYSTGSSGSYKSSQIIKFSLIALLMIF